MPQSHQWIFDVLKDLRRYALANDLPALARKAEEALQTARAEIAALVREAGPDATGDPGRDAAPGNDSGPGQRGKMH